MQQNIFLSVKDTKNTAMREIAAKADVGLSNIYNYFPNKDSLFRYILQPVVDELYTMLYNHDVSKANLEMFTSHDYQKKEIELYMALAGTLSQTTETAPVSCARLLIG